MKVTYESIINLNTDLCTYIRVIEENGFKVLNILKGAENFLYCSGMEAVVRKVPETDNCFTENLNVCKKHINNLIDIAHDYENAERSNTDKVNGID